MSIRKLALKSGVRRQSIMAFLAGANLSIENLQKLLKALGFELQMVEYEEGNDASISGRDEINGASAALPSSATPCDVQLVRLGRASSGRLASAPFISSRILTATRFPIEAKNLAQICKTYGIKRLALFGSVLGQDFKTDSDIDVLVEFKKPVSFFTLGEIAERLEKASGCRRKIDLVTAGALSPYIKEEVLSNCEVLYEEAA